MLVQPNRGNTLQYMQLVVCLEIMSPNYVNEQCYDLLLNVDGMTIVLNCTMLNSSTKRLNTWKQMTRLDHSYPRSHMFLDPSTATSKLYVSFRVTCSQVHLNYPDHNKY